MRACRRFDDAWAAKVVHGRPHAGARYAIRLHSAPTDYFYPRAPAEAWRCRVAASRGSADYLYFHWQLSGTVEAERLHIGLHTNIVVHGSQGMLQGVAVYPGAWRMRVGWHPACSLALTAQCCSARPTAAGGRRQRHQLPWTDSVRNFRPRAPPTPPTRPHPPLAAGSSARDSPQCPSRPCPTTMRAPTGVRRCFWCALTSSDPRRAHRLPATGCCRARCVRGDCGRAERAVRAEVEARAGAQVHEGPVTRGGRRRCVHQNTAKRHRTHARPLSGTAASFGHAVRPKCQT